jgi:hypothetical protein
MNTTNDATVNAAAGAAALVFVLIELVLCVLIIAGMWKVFTKAGQPGWAAIIPIFNLYILITIAGKPWWWLLLMLIPLVNFVIAILIYIALAEKFGKGVGYAIGMVFLPFIFLPMLGFSDAQYQGGASAPPVI